MFFHSQARTLQRYYHKQTRQKQRQQVAFPSHAGGMLADNFQLEMYTLKDVFPDCLWLFAALKSELWENRFYNVHWRREESRFHSVSDSTNGFQVWNIENSEENNRIISSSLFSVKIKSDQKQSCVVEYRVPLLSVGLLVRRFIWNSCLLVMF